MKWVFFSWILLLSADNNWYDGRRHQNDSMPPLFVNPDLTRALCWGIPYRYVLIAVGMFSFNVHCALCIHRMRRPELDKHNFRRGVLHNTIIATVGHRSWVSHFFSVLFQQICQTMRQNGEPKQTLLTPLPVSKKKKPHMYFVCKRNNTTS